PSPSQIRGRTMVAFSPMPPANTRVSSPPNAAANAPIHFLFSRPHVLRFTVEQVTHVGTGLRQTEQPGLKIDHLIESFCGEALGAPRIPKQSGIEFAGVGTHRHPGCRGETHACVHGFASRTAARLAPLPRWARMTRPCAASDPAKRAGSPIRNAYNNP